MTFDVKLLVFLKDGILDTQGKAVAGSLKRLGFDAVKDVRVGKYIRLSLQADDQATAEKAVAQMCSDLLVNDIIEDWSAEYEEGRR